MLSYETLKKSQRACEAIELQNNDQCQNKIVLQKPELYYMIHTVAIEVWEEYASTTKNKGELEMSTCLMCVLHGR